MRDVALVSLPELRALLSECIARRIEAVDPAERARTGEDLLLVISELELRGDLDRLRLRAPDAARADVGAGCPQSSSAQPQTAPAY